MELCSLSPVFGIFPRARMMTATPNAAAFPKAMRRLGWVLPGTMLLYPVDAFLGEREYQRWLAAELASRGDAAAVQSQFTLHWS
jgi:hypothetical protein